MPFDPAKIRSIFEDPLFQFGLSTIGRSRDPNAMAQGMAALQNARKIQADRLQQQQEFEQQKAYQAAQIANMQETRRISQEQLERQMTHDQAITERAERDWEYKQDKDEREEDEDEDLIEALRGRMPGATPAAPMPKASMVVPKAGANAKVSAFNSQYSPAIDLISKRLRVAPHLLSGQFGLETGWGKSVIPGTNNLGNIKGAGGVMATDNANGSRDSYRKYNTLEEFANDYATLIEQNYPDAIGAGEDSAKFFTALKNGKKGSYAEDPGYVLKGQVAAAMAKRNAAQAAPQPQVEEVQNQLDPLAVQQLGVMRAARGRKGGRELVTYGQNLHSQSQDVIKNEQEERKMEFEERKMGQKDTEIELDTQRTNATIEEKTTKIKGERAGVIGAAQETVDSMDMLSKASKELMQMPGLESTTGLKGIFKLYNATESGRDAAAALETLQSKVAVDQLMKMKALSANGASGFGALSGPELRLLETYTTNLSKATSLAARKKALKDLVDFAELTKSRVHQKLKNSYGTEGMQAPSVGASGNWGDAPTTPKKVPYGSLK